MNGSSILPSLPRPLTWLEEQIVLSSEVTKKRVNEIVSEQRELIKAHVVSALQTGRSIRYPYKPDVPVFLKKLVKSKLETELNKLGLTLFENALESYVDVSWIASDFDLALRHIWGDLTDEQFAEMIKPYSKKIDTTR